MIGLLSFNILSSCANTRKELGYWSFSDRTKAWAGAGMAFLTTIVGGGAIYKHFQLKQLGLTIEGSKNLERTRLTIPTCEGSAYKFNKPLSNMDSTQENFIMNAINRKSYDRILDRDTIYKIESSRRRFLKKNLKNVLDQGVDINAENKYGIPLIMHMTDKVDSRKIMEYMKQRGADLCIKDRSGQTVLHYAKKPEDVDFLIKNGVKVNTEDESHETPLFKAVKDERVEVIKALLKNGANPCILNKDNKTAKDYIGGPVLIFDFGETKRRNDMREILDNAEKKCKPKESTNHHFDKGRQKTRPVK